MTASTPASLPTGSQLVAHLRATARLLTRDGWNSVSGLVTVVSAPLVTMFLFVPEPVVRAMLHTFQLLLVVILGMHLRGRVVAAGPDPLSEPGMPMLPVSPLVRALAVVIVGEALLLGFTAGIGALAWYGLPDAPPTNPFAGAGIAPADLPRVLVVLGLCYAPLLATGSTAGGGVMLTRGSVYLLGIFGLAWLEVDVHLGRALAWCVVGVPLIAVLPSARGTRDARGVGRALAGGVVGERLRRALGGALAGARAVVPVTFVLCLGMGVGLAVLARALGMPTKDAVEMGGLCGTLAGAMLPVLPPVWGQGALRPNGIEVLAWLPVSRTRAVVSVLGASLGRTAALAAVGAIAELAVGGGVLYRPLAVFASGFCLAASLHLAGMPRRQWVALPGMLLGMLALLIGVDLHGAIPEVLVRALPVAPLAFASLVTLRARRRGLFAG